MADEAEALKVRGNGAFKAGDLAGALACYDGALGLLALEGSRAERVGCNAKGTAMIRYGATQQATT